MNVLISLSSFLLISLGYFLGSIPSGYLAGRWVKGIDIRKFGSGSTGATNVLRNVGKGSALIVFLIDVAKGIISVLIAKALTIDDWVHVLTGLAALTGHIWPIWLSFKGGKAVATGLGMFIGLAWPVGISCLGIFIVTLTFFRIVSLSSIVASIFLPAMMYFFDSNTAYLTTSLIAMMLVLWKHHSNLQRIIAGIEPMIGKKEKTINNSANSQY